MVYAYEIFADFHGIKIETLSSYEIHFTLNRTCKEKYRPQNPNRENIPIASWLSSESITVRTKHYSVYNQRVTSHHCAAPHVTLAYLHRYNIILYLHI